MVVLGAFKEQFVRNPCSGQAGDLAIVYLVFPYALPPACNGAGAAVRDGAGTVAAEVGKVVCSTVARAKPAAIINVNFR